MDKKTLQPTTSKRKILFGILGITLFSAKAISKELNDNEQPFILQQQRAVEQAQYATPSVPDIRLAVSDTSSNVTLFPQETPCFLLSKVVLENQESLPSWLPLQSLAESAVGNCIGIQGVNNLLSKLQNRLMSHGWITTRVVAPEQDISNGQLVLRIIPGQVHQLRYASSSDSYASLTSAIPLRAGGLLDLRAIEQGLENLQRIPNVTANMELLPATISGQSDILIYRTQSRFWHVGMWADNSGTKNTGKNQGGILLALDNPTSLSDLFYISAVRDLSFSNRHDSVNYTLHYSVPLGYWQLALTGSQYHYAQTVPQLNEEVKYRGKSRNFNAHLTRLLYRNATSRTSLSYAINIRETRNFIRKTEIAVQRRLTSQWRAGLNHRHYLGKSVLDIALTYQKGTRWFGAMPAWEERLRSDSADYATALSEIVQYSLGWVLPFQIGQQRWRYRIDYFRQWTHTPLTPQDKISIGTRWTIRGFDGERQLSSDEGWYWRNTLTWESPLPGKRVYWGLDYGRVVGRDSPYLIGQALYGVVLGSTGEFSKLNLSYDVSIGTPLFKPSGFKSNKISFEFSINWQY